ncbi:hypothetical protein DENIS_0830 [Desulfonema ishimotonii]|uniref:VWFA domain-containing protein n=2 Tax=Desulfonema ishimotonii TaxID=45657 RepID=A0A401FSF4_9BACT|nr:hypothetical protein DENIS_0830 [Desulfonema ishimotonii]
MVPDGNFEYPWALMLLFGIPLVFYRKRGGTARAFSAISLISSVPEPGWFRRHGPDLLGGLFLATAVLGIANFRYSASWQGTELESRWIMMVQDLSGSMNRPAGGGGGKTLGDAALAGIRAFIDMREADDLIGLIAFSSYAKLISPPTFDKKVLKQKLGLLDRTSDSVIFRELTAGGATNASYATWLALCTFFMLLPEEHQLTFEEMDDFRYALLGTTLESVSIPEKLRRAEFGHGMAVVLFTDGRIEAGKSDADVRKGLPNFVNVIKLMRKLGIKFYLIALNRDVHPDVRSALEERPDGEGAGRIFYMPRGFSPEKIAEVYEKIHRMEKNRLLVRFYKKQKATRGIFALAAAILLAAYGFLTVSPGFRRV